MSDAHKQPEAQGHNQSPIADEAEKDWSQYFDYVVQWARDRNIIQGTHSHGQMLKLMEEMGEVAHALARSNHDELKDGIGDVMVVLTILAAQNGLSIKECLISAYNEIKDRKGKMVNGIFVKEQDW